jgi:hypothetical protein
MPGNRNKLRIRHYYKIKGTEMPPKSIEKESEVQEMKIKLMKKIHNPKIKELCLQKQMQPILQACQKVNFHNTEKSA